MHRLHWHRLVLASVVTAFTVFTSVIFVPSPARAYPFGAVWVQFAVVDTDNCARIQGTLTVISQPDRCFLPDSVDDTYFYKDPGGVAIKCVLYNSSGAMLAKQEFHPYGEKLWVYDTMNDGDTVYAWLQDLDNPLAIYGPYAPTGTSNVIDYKVIDLDLPEGTHLELLVFDDPSWASEDWFALLPGAYA